MLHALCGTEETFSRPACHDTNLLIILVCFTFYTVRIYNKYFLVSIISYFHRFFRSMESAQLLSSVKFSYFSNFEIMYFSITFYNLPA